MLADCRKIAFQVGALYNFEAIGVGMAVERARRASDFEMERPRIVDGREGSKP